MGTEKPTYSRDELARLERSLRELSTELQASFDGTGEFLHLNRATDLDQAADFLAETVGTLDRQRKAARDRAAAGIIEKRKTRPRRRRLRK